MRSRTASAAVSVLVVLAVACVLSGPAFAAPAEPAAAPAGGQAVKVLERTDAGGGVIVARLENGLTVIVKPTRTAPVVCVKAFVHAGGIYEKEFLGCGLSHLCEHLVAKGEVAEDGAAAKGGGETRSVVSDIGGQSNAYTSMEMTCYYIEAAAGKTPECIDYVAGMMAAPDFTEPDFIREHGVKMAILSVPAAAVIAARQHE